MNDTPLQVEEKQVLKDDSAVQACCIDSVLSSVQEKRGPSEITNTSKEEETRKKLRFESSSPKKKKRKGFMAPPRLATAVALPTIVVNDAPPILSEKDEDLPSPSSPTKKEVVLLSLKKKKKKCNGFRAPSTSSIAISYKEHERLIMRGEPRVEVPPLLCQFLRSHQRDGVLFMLDCLGGRLVFPDGHKRYGAILADDMGLGKTLQTIATVYTLLKAKSTAYAAQRVVVTCPCSLVPNWANEFDKWINSRVQMRSDRVEVKAITEGSRLLTRRAVQAFVAPTKPYDILVLSYEALRASIDNFTTNNCIDILVCDEAQRLKGAKTQLNAAFSSLDCERRILLTGTPLQNNLEEFRTMANVALPPSANCPPVLGTEYEFRQHFDFPIAAGREPDADNTTKALGLERQRELAQLSRLFVLRRENTLNAIHLPPKLVQVVCLRMPEQQRIAYTNIVDDKHLQHALQGKQTDVFSYINRLQKLCAHPFLEKAKSASTAKDLVRDSAKLLFVWRLLRTMRKQNEGERIVIVANATSALELVAALCDREHMPWCLLDGSTPIEKRKELNKRFNDPQDPNQFVFLLSSTAGGCGLNLIGANRLVLFDQSWNPATDKQAAARCWRDGNTRRCYTYRLLTACTIEEKVFQRQLSKEGLLSVVEDRDQLNAFSSEDLKRLFVFEANITCSTHHQLGCDCTGSTTTKSQATTANTITPGAVADACRAYLDMNHFLEAYAEELPEDVRKNLEERVKKLDLRLPTTQICSGTDQQNLILTVPQLRRELEKQLTAVCSPLTETILIEARARLDSTWRELVPKLYDAMKKVEVTDKSDLVQQVKPTLTHKPQVGLPAEEDLKNWSHHSSIETIDDDVLRTALGGPYQGLVSFIFGLETNADLIKAQQDTES